MSTTGNRRIKRVFISKYENGSVLSQDLLKAFTSGHFCAFVIFKDWSELSSAHNSYGKKSFVPILLNSEDGKSKEDLEKILKNLPLMDYIVNSSGRVEVSKHFEKLKPIRSVEMKLHKATAKQILDTFHEVQKEACIINLTSSENSVGVTHIFDREGAQTPLRTHLSTTLRNSFRKIFPAKFSSSLDEPDRSRTPDCDDKPSRSRSLPRLAQPSTSAANSRNAAQDRSNGGGKLRRSLSLFKRKSRSNATGDPENSRSGLDDVKNQVWAKENESLKKSMNKLQKESMKAWVSKLRKLNSKKEKHEQKVDKDLEDQMNRERANLQAKTNDLNAATLSRSSALTEATANKIVASREARINKEVGRSANKRKVQEFEKLEEFFKQQVEESKLKHYHKTVRAEIVCLEKTTKKYQERFRDAEIKYIATGGR